MSIGEFYACREYLLFSLSLWDSTLTWFHVGHQGCRGLTSTFLWACINPTCSRTFVLSSSHWFSSCLVPFSDWGCSILYSMSSDSPSCLEDPRGRPRPWCLLSPAQSWLPWKEPWSTVLRAGARGWRVKIKPLPDGEMLSPCRGPWGLAFSPLASRAPSAALFLRWLRWAHGQRCTAPNPQRHFPSIMLTFHKKRPKAGRLNTSTATRTLALAIPYGPFVIVEFTKFKSPVLLLIPKPWEAVGVFAVPACLSQGTPQLWCSTHQRVSNFCNNLRV